MGHKVFKRIVYDQYLLNQSSPSDQSGESRDIDRVVGNYGSNAASVIKAKKKAEKKKREDQEMVRKAMGEEALAEADEGEKIRQARAKQMAADQAKEAAEKAKEAAKHAAAVAQAQFDLTLMKEQYKQTEEF